MYDEDEFWNFEVPYGEEFMEFFDNLKNSVKEDITKEISDLKEENTRLKKIVDNIDNAQRNIDRQKRDLEIATKQSVNSAKRLALEELIEPMKQTYWDIAYNYEKLPKCDKCDDYRRREYTTPLGRKEYEICTCDVGHRTYMPKELTLYSVFKHDKELMGYYNFKDSTYGNDSLRYYGFWEDELNESKRSDKALISTKEDFPNYSRFESVFATEEICQEYCKLLQEKEDSEKPNINENVALAPVEIL